MSGSARKQDFVAKAASLTQTKQVGGSTVRLTPSGTQPGLTEYDVTVARAGGPVKVAFSSPKLGVPPTAVVATHRGGDGYRVAGIYTPVIGAWKVAVTTPGTSRAATFDLGINATPPELPDPPPVLVTSSTWKWGIGEAIVVVAALCGALLATTRRSRSSMEPATQST
jgi:hypothetical protein